MTQEQEQVYWKILKNFMRDNHDALMNYEISFFTLYSMAKEHAEKKIREQKQES